MDKQPSRPRLPGVLEGTPRAILRVGAGPRNPLLWDDPSGLPTTQPSPGIMGSMEMGPRRVPEGLG